MSDTSPPGSSDWWPGSDSDDPSVWWPQPAFTVQRGVAGVVPGGDYVRGSTTYSTPAYHTPGSTGATTPDPPDTAITGPVRITWKVRPSGLTAANSDQTLGSQWGAAPLVWYFAERQASAGLIFGGSFDGSAQNIFQVMATNAELAVALPDGVDGYIGIQIEPSIGRLTALTSKDGISWSAFGTVRTVAPFTLIDSTQPLRVGTRTLTTQWLGRMYWAQQERLNPDGTSAGIVWRFDPDEFTGTASDTTFTDPRGRVWTIAAGSITPKVVVGPDVQKSALRFPTTTDFGIEELTGTGVFYARPLDYGAVEITWGITLDLNKWNEVAVVRSAMGFPATVNEGQTIFRATQAKLFPQGYTTNKDADGKQPVEARKIYDPRDMPGVGTQVTLPGGFWYYYTLFFRSGTKWHKYMVTSALLPRNYHHAEHLFNNLPPYYQWTDEQMRGGAGDGDLRRFLKLIGFDLDLTREYVQGWLDLYHTDFTPVPLLRRLGVNFGVPYEAGIGDIRYRGLISKIGFLYRSRGTARGLREMVVSVTKCSTEVTPSANIMLLPDDSDFFEGTGSWAGIHPTTPLTGMVVTNPLPASRVRLAHGVTTPPVPDNSGRGMMRMWTSKADATASVFITCGDGIASIWGSNFTLEVNNATHTHTAATVLLNSVSVNNAAHTIASSHVALS